MKRIAPHTVRELLYWSVAGYAEAVEEINKQKRVNSHSRFRDIIYLELQNGTKSLDSILLQYALPVETNDKCVYCGNSANSADHLIPRIAGGSDDSANLVLCCKHCNSSKGAKDLMEWMSENDKFPSLPILNKYLMLCFHICEKNNLLNSSLQDPIVKSLPFNIFALPLDYPPYEQFRKFDNGKESQINLSLDEAVSVYSGQQKQAILKLLSENEILTWQDFTKEKLERLRENLLSSKSQSTARTYIATLWSILWQFEGQKGIYPNYRSVLYVRNDRPSTITLTESELNCLIEYSPKSENKKYVRDCFILCAKTGIKRKELDQIDMASINDKGVLIYFPQRSKPKRTIELDSYSIELLDRIKKSELNISLMHFNRTIRSIAKEAGITDMISLHRRGKDEICMKYECLSEKCAWDTYKVLTKRCEILSESKIGNATPRERLNTDNKGTIELSSFIQERIEQENISYEELSAAVGVNTQELIQALNNNGLISIPTIEQLLWILNDASFPENNIEVN